MVLSIISKDNTKLEIPINGLAPDKIVIDEQIAEKYSLSCEIILSKMNAEIVPLIKNENYIRVSSNGQTYRIKGISGASRRKTAIKQLTAEHIFFDIIGVKKDKSTMINESATFERAMNYALDGTGWSWKIADGSFFEAKTYEGFAGNSLELFKKLQTRHNFEWYPDSRNLTVYLYTYLGRETEAQFRYNYNIINVTDKTTTTDIVNIRKGYGKKKLFTEENPEPPILVDSDYKCVALWKDDASILAYGERWGDDYENENYTIEENLREYLGSISNPTPILSLTLSYAVLAEYGEAIPDDIIDLGNSVWVIHEPQNLEVQARILTRKLYPESVRKSTEITLANVKTSVVTQNTRVRQELATLRAETTRELSKIGGINTDTGQLATSFEELAVQVQGSKSDIVTLNTSVTNLSTQIDDLSESQNTVITTVGDITPRVDAAESNATAANNKATQALSAVTNLSNRTVRTLTLPTGVTGTVKYVANGVNVSIEIALTEVTETTEIELPYAPVLGDFRAWGSSLNTVTNASKPVLISVVGGKIEVPALVGEDLHCSLSYIY